MAGEWVEERKVGVGHSGEIPPLSSISAETASDWVRDVAWAPNTAMPFNVIASCSEDKTVKIWKQVIARSLELNMHRDCSLVGEGGPLAQLHHALLRCSSVATELVRHRWEKNDCHHIS